MTDNLDGFEITGPDGSRAAYIPELFDADVRALASEVLTAGGKDLSKLNTLYNLKEHNELIYVKAVSLAAGRLVSDFCLQEAQTGQLPFYMKGYHLFVLHCRSLDLFTPTTKETP